MMAAKVIFDFRKMCEQHRLSMHTNIGRTQFKADWTTLKNCQL